MNTRMANLLSNEEVQQRIRKGKLARRLASLLAGGVEEQKGVWLLRAMMPKGFNIDMAVSRSFDRTDLECSNNHVHLEGFVGWSRRSDREYLVAQGYMFSRRLTTMLEAQGSFEIILSYGEGEDPGGCIVRFHRIREGEDYLCPDLEGYEDDGILVFRTGALPVGRCGQE